MVASASLALCAGIATFVRTEFFSTRNGTFTLRMGAVLFSHDDLLVRITLERDNQMENWENALA
jgi:hypothetical protein